MRRAFVIVANAPLREAVFMTINARLDVSGQQASIATMQDWQELGAWIEETADETIPLTRIWNLTHLATYGWASNLKKLAKELHNLLARGDLPPSVREVLGTLARIVTRGTPDDEQINVVCSEA
jgi:hypothetical protein